MSDIVRHDSQNWGEDPHGDYALAKSKNELLYEAEAKVRASYLKVLRANFEKDPVTRAILEKSKPATACMEELAMHLADLIRRETPDLFRKALAELLVELDWQRAAPPALYAVDESTGLATVPINQSMIYQPPDYIGDDGKLHKARPVLHPKVAAPMTMARYERARTAEAIAKGGAAMEHVRNPDSIREAAIVVLSDMGVKVGTVTDGRTVNLEFGKEHVDSFQSMNPRFHRHAAFGRVLARMIVGALAGGRLCDIGSVQAKVGPKLRWYEVRIDIPST